MRIKITEIIFFIGVVLFIFYGTFFVVDALRTIGTQNKVDMYQEYIIRM